MDLQSRLDGWKAIFDIEDDANFELSRIISESLAQSPSRQTWSGHIPCTCEDELPRQKPYQPDTGDNNTGLVNDECANAERPTSGTIMSPSNFDGDMITLLVYA